MFKVEIIGNLGQDARINENTNGKFVSFSVAHSRKWIDAQRVEHQETEWFSCTLNGDGGALLQYLKSGQQVFLRGDGKLRMWEDANHYQHPGCDVRVTEIQLCGSKNN